MSCFVHMLGCGVVLHPQQWEWLGLHEILGRRQRYRLLDLDKLYWPVREDRLEDLRLNLSVSLEEAIAKDELKREPCWTESIAVGSAGLLAQIQPLTVSRRKNDTEQAKGREHADAERVTDSLRAKNGSKKLL